jgi:formamidopyrimidine-DNA glycosylase
MPELPEVETVRAGLIPAMEGQVIEKADIRRPDLRFPFPDRMAERLTGARVERLRRRSKYILADLSTGETLLIHLGMSGRMLISGQLAGDFYHDHPAPAKHDHVVLDMAGGARVTFNDARRFGAMDLMATEGAETHWLLRGIGPEPLGNDFHENYLQGHLKGRKMPIKSALLDQRLVAGLGNIYVCEFFFGPESILAVRLVIYRQNRPRALSPLYVMYCKKPLRQGGQAYAIIGRPTGN